MAASFPLGRTSCTFVWILLFSLFGSSLQAQNNYFKTPEALGKAIFEAIRAQNSAALISLKPSKADLIEVDTKMAQALGLDEAAIKSIETEIDAKCAEKAQKANEELTFFANTRLKPFCELMSREQGVIWPKAKFGGLLEPDKDRFYGIDTEFIVKFTHRKEAFSISYRAAQLKAGWLLIDSNIGFGEVSK